MESLAADIAGWLLDSRASMSANDKVTPVLVTGINDISGAVAVVWVAPAEQTGDDPVFCTSLFVNDALTGSCGSPGLIVDEPEPPNTPSRYTLPTLGLATYSEATGYELPINIGSANLPLETSYTILVGPNGEKWLQQPISATVLFAVDPAEPKGIYELSAYDADGNELAVGWFSV